MGMKFVTTLERDEDGVWIAECPSVPGCVSQGQTRDEALANIREAIAACLEVRAERGLPLTIETQQVQLGALYVFSEASASGAAFSKASRSSGCVNISMPPSGVRGHCSRGRS